jgi:hypothetical protein
LFKLKTYNIGFALKDFEDKGKVELVSVFNNEPFVKNIGRVMIRNCMDHGARYLDHFDGFLTELYSSMGFVEYKRDPYNPEYDPDGAFRKRYGPKDVIYRKL